MWSALQSIEVYLNNSTKDTVKFTVKVTTNASDGMRRDSNKVFILSENDKRDIGCTKGSVLPSLDMR